MDQSTTSTCPDPVFSPKKYLIVEKIGKGAFGNVYKVLRKEHGTRKLFALKKPRGGVETINYSEVEAMKLLKHEENFVKFIEVIKHGDQFGVVMELCRADLRKVLFYKNIEFDMSHIKNMLKQLFTGLAAMHRKRIMHRDLKADNILISNEGVIKIGDLGSSVVIESQACFSANVCTLWYRSPELLFGSRKYDEKVDMWSSGLISIEFFTREPGLFRGDDDTDQMKKISEICGFCSEHIWSEAKEFPFYKEYHKKFANYKNNTLEIYLKEIIHCPSATEFIAEQLQLVPDRRMTAENALRHNFLTSGDEPAVDLQYILQQLK
ncbi:cyclin-dependent-like kinase 5 isoform X3 [Nilaparvata lugens]|uniref:cyclin-dependent-like kinase 5 isoform X3 n=1 Tax=Nilaparvata lugens TaxID=108931 RepID=UPI00193E9827|nr:cyclin-dependent-like kinase 5 isoform X3 [Nilaparvata lugens]